MHNKQARFQHTQLVHQPLVERHVSFTWIPLRKKFYFFIFFIYIQECELLNFNIYVTK